MRRWALRSRVVVLGLGVLCCAWFALSARQAHELATASAIVESGQRLSPGQVRHAMALLDAAATLNPDPQVDVVRGELAAAEGQLARARRILAGVIRREPRNLAAFEAYARASTDNERAYFAAQVGIGRLVRFFPPSR